MSRASPTPLEPAASAARAAATSRRPVGRLAALWLLVTSATIGAVVMAVELLGARLLGAGYGGSLIVWAAMISVTLLSLAIGYFVGGALSDRRPRPAVLYGVLLAAAVLVVICPYERFVLAACYEAMGITGGALVSSICLFFLPLALLGVTGPFVIRLLSEVRRGMGMTAGSVYAISTLGSVAGTLLTGLWLIPAFGTAAGFLLAAAAAAAVSLLGLLASVRARTSCVLLLPPLLLLGGLGPWVPWQRMLPGSGVGQTYTAPDGEQVTVLAAEESAYSHLVVLQKGQYNLLMADGIVQTGVPRDLERLGKCELLRNAYYFQELLPYMIDDPAGSKVLVIGLAGGMTASLLAGYDMDVFSVDLDPEAIRLAREYFGFKGQAIAADGRRFLEDCRTKYDFCVIDTYSGDVFPFHLASVEAFRAAHASLKADGVLAVNFIGSPKGLPFACIYRTLAAAFRNVLALRGEPGDDVQTITLLAADRPIEFNRGWLAYVGGAAGVDPITEQIADMTVAPRRSDGFVLTDDYNPIDSLRAEEALRWRKRTAERVGRPAVF